MGLVDFERAWLDLKREIAGRPSHGAGALMEAMTRLELEHAIDESAEQAFLRRFETHLTDTFLGLLPLPVTDDPLTAADPDGTSAAMAGGATFDQPTEGDAPCQSRLRSERRAATIRDQDGREGSLAASAQRSGSLATSLS